MLVQAAVLGRSPPGHMQVQAEAAFGQMIERTMYSASGDETCYDLNGVYLEVLADSGAGCERDHKLYAESAGGIDHVEEAPSLAEAAAR